VKEEKEIKSNIPIYSPKKEKKKRKEKRKETNAREISIVSVYVRQLDRFDFSSFQLRSNLSFMKLPSLELAKTHRK